MKKLNYSVIVLLTICIVILGATFYYISKNKKETNSVAQSILETKTGSQESQKNITATDTVRVINYEVEYEQGKGLIKTKLSDADKKLKDDAIFLIQKTHNGYPQDDSYLELMAVSPDYLYLAFGVGIGVSHAADHYVIDLKSNAIIDNFKTSGDPVIFVNDKTFVFVDSNEVFSYTYGTRSHVSLEGSKLPTGQSYVAYTLSAGAFGGQISTTTSSITFGVFDSEKGEQTTEDAFYYKKLGEKTFNLK